MFTAPFPKMNWQMKVIYWLAIVIFYIAYPFLWLYEKLKEVRA